MGARSVACHHLSDDFFYVDGGAHAACVRDEEVTCLLWVWTLEHARAIAIVERHLENPVVVNGHLAPFGLHPPGARVRDPSDMLRLSAAARGARTTCRGVGHALA